MYMLQYNEMRTATVINALYVQSQRNKNRRSPRFKVVLVKP